MDSPHNTLGIILFVIGLIDMVLAQVITRNLPNKATADLIKTVMTVGGGLIAAAGIVILLNLPFISKLFQ